MEIQSELLELGNPEKVGNLVSLLNIIPDDFKDPMRFEKIRSVLGYLSKHSDPSYFIYKGLGSKQVDRVDFMHEYIGRHQELTAAEERVAKLREEISVYEK